MLLGILCHQDPFYLQVLLDVFLHRLGSMGGFCQVHRGNHFLAFAFSVVLQPNLVVRLVFELLKTEGGILQDRGIQGYFLLTIKSRPCFS